LDLQEMLRNLPFELILRNAQEWSGPLAAVAAGIFKLMSPFARRSTKDKARLQHVHDYTEKYSKSGDFLMEAGFAPIMGKTLFSANEIRLGARKVFPTEFFRIYAGCRTLFNPGDRMLGKLTPNPAVATPAKRFWSAVGFFVLYLLLTIPVGIAFSYGLPAFYKAGEWGSFAGTIVLMVASGFLGFSCVNQSRRMTDVTRVLEWPDQPEVRTTVPSMTDQQIRIAKSTGDGVPFVPVDAALALSTVAPTTSVDQANGEASPNEWQ